MPPPVDHELGYLLQNQGTDPSDAVLTCKTGCLMLLEPRPHRLRVCPARLRRLRNLWPLQVKKKKKLNFGTRWDSPSEYERCDQLLKKDGSGVFKNTSCMSCSGSREFLSYIKAPWLAHSFATIVWNFQGVCAQMLPHPLWSSCSSHSQSRSAHPLHAVCYEQGQTYLK